MSPSAETNSISPGKFCHHTSMKDNFHYGPVYWTMPIKTKDKECHINVLCMEWWGLALEKVKKNTVYHF